MRVFVRLREWAGILYDGSMIPDTFLAGVLSCVWCASMWVGIFWMGFWLCAPEWSLKIAVPFAFSAMGILIETEIRRGK